MRPPARTSLWLVGAGVLAFAGATAWMNWVRYASLRSTWPLDLGLLHNQAFNVAHGRDLAYLPVPAWFDTAEHEGPSVYRSSHFSPLRLALVPQVYRLRPRITTLMALQGLLIGAGALGLYALAAERAGSARLGLLLAGSYLAHPAVLHVAFNDYREIALGMGPALVALWAHATGRLALFVPAALVMLAARSEYTLLLAAFGLLNWRLADPVRRRRWAFILLPPALALLWAALAHAYYRYAYGVDWPLLRFSLERGPLETAVALAGRIPPFLATLLLPALVGLATPEVLVAALPFVALARDVHWPGFPHHHLQHLSPAMVAVFWAFASTLVRLWAGPVRISRRQLGIALGGVAAAVFLAFAWAALRAYPPAAVAGGARLGAVSDALPADATVLVPMRLLARFSGHTRAMTPELLPVAPGASASERQAALDDVVALADVVVAEAGSSLAARASATRLFDEQAVSGYHVAVRRTGAPRPARPDAELQRALGWDRLPPRRRLWVRVQAGP